jgi:hypothetical protein
MMALNETGSISLEQLLREKSWVFAGGRHFFLDNSTYVFLMSPHEPTGVSRSILGQGPTEATLSPDIAEWSIVATKAEDGCLQ